MYYFLRLGLRTISVADVVSIVDWRGGFVPMPIPVKARAAGSPGFRSECEKGRHVVRHRLNGGLCRVLVWDFEDSRWSESSQLGR